MSIQRGRAHVKQRRSDYHSTAYVCKALHSIIIFMLSLRLEFCKFYNFIQENFASYLTL